MATWQLQEAKNRLSEVVECALRNGPQTITRHGKEAVIVVASADYRKLSQRLQNGKSLLDFFLKSPLRNSGLKIQRDRDPGRNFDL